MSHFHDMDFILIEVHIMHTYAHQGCIYLIKNKVKKRNVKYYYNLKSLFSFFIHLKNLIYFCDPKLNFQHNYCSF